MGLYEVPLYMSLLGIGMGTMLATFHICGIMLVFSAVINMLVRNANPRGIQTTQPTIDEAFIADTY